MPCTLKLPSLHPHRPVNRREILARLQPSMLLEPVEELEHAGLRHALIARQVYILQAKLRSQARIPYAKLSAEAQARY